MKKMDDDEKLLTDTAKLYFKVNESTGAVSCRANFAKDISAELYKRYRNAEKVSVSLYEENYLICIQKL